MDPLIGVLALQGGFAPHDTALRKAGARTRPVRRAPDLEGLDGLVLPGGESTTVSLLLGDGLDAGIRGLAAKGIPLLGTCAGAILLARLGSVDVDVERNAYGRQIHSFVGRVRTAGCGEIEGVFIRAPAITACGPGVRVLGRLGDAPVWVRDGAAECCTFHPELSPDAPVHAHFVERARYARSP